MSEQNEKINIASLSSEAINAGLARGAMLLSGVESGVEQAEKAKAMKLNGFRPAKSTLFVCHISPSWFTNEHWVVSHSRVSDSIGRLFDPNTLTWNQLVKEFLAYDGSDASRWGVPVVKCTDKLIDDSLNGDWSRVKVGDVEDHPTRGPRRLMGASGALNVGYFTSLMKIIPKRQRADAYWEVSSSLELYRLRHPEQEEPIAFCMGMFR